MSNFPLTVHFTDIHHYEWFSEMNGDLKRLYSPLFLLVKTLFHLLCCLWHKYKIGLNRKISNETFHNLK